MLDLINHKEFQRLVSKCDPVIVVYVCSELQSWLKSVSHRLGSSSDFGFYRDSYISCHYSNTGFYVFIDGIRYNLAGSSDEVV